MSQNNFDLIEKTINQLQSKCGKTIQIPSDLEKRWKNMADKVDSRTAQETIDAIQRKDHKFIQKADES